jgi:hypothetical protein
VRNKGAKMSFEITATQISQWFTSDSRRAQELLPALVSRLALATAVTKGFRFPDGNSIRLHGPDGRTQAKVGNDFIPEGDAVWEMGTSRDNQKKANDDFDKPIPPGVDAANTAYVAVTPHPWERKDAWRDAKNAMGNWREVRTIDAVDLEAWLRMAPAVKRWLMAEMGVPVTGLRDVDLYWRELAAQYNFESLAPLIVIGGRKEARQRLRDALLDGQRTIAIQGESPEEACMFAAAVIREFDTAEEPIRFRTVFLDSAEAADWISGCKSEHVAIPTTVEARRRILALRPANVLIVEPRDRHGPGRDLGDSVPIRLGSVAQLATEHALAGANLTPQIARRIALQCKGSLTAVLWGLSLGADEALPWTTGENPAKLLPLLLAGQWDSLNANDKEAVGTLAGQGHGQVEETASAWGEATGPLIMRGSIWDWKAVDFAWKELAPALTHTLLDWFADVAYKVFGTADPAIKLPVEQRWVAPISGVGHPCSAQLRSGLVTSIIQLGLLGDEKDGQGRADCIVRSLLSGGKLPRVDAWCSLAYWLPDLAEAAPDAFLQCLDGLLSDRDAVKRLFEESGLLGGSSAHTYVLWALERLAWPKEFFPRVVATLAHLSQLDPGGSTMNRPINSLSDILLPARPRTNADVEARKRAFENMYSSFPEQAWTLAVSLLHRTTQGGLVMNTAEPRWRTDWMAPAGSRQPSVNEVGEFLQWLVEKMTAWATTDGNRWAEIVDSLIHLLHTVPGLVPEILDKLKLAEPAISDANQRGALVVALRKVTNFYHQFPSERRPPPADFLGELEEINAVLQPRDLKDRHKWLFTSWPDVPQDTRSGYEEHQKRVDSLRFAAIKEVVAAEGINGALLFAIMVERPGEVGASLAALPDADTFDVDILAATLREKLEPNAAPPMLSLGWAYLSRRYRDKGADWLERIRRSDGIEWNLNSLFNLACGLPCSEETWDMLENWDASLPALYWQRVPIDSLANHDRDLRRACEELARAGRFLQAVYLAGLYARTTQDADGKHTAFNFDPEMVVQLLKGAADQDMKNMKKGWFPPPGSIGYSVERLLDHLENAGVESLSLAELEWLWLPVIHTRGPRAARALGRMMAESPKWFVDVLAHAFRRRGEPAPEGIDENQKRLAENAYQLLQDWDQAPGSHAKQPNGSTGREFPFPSGDLDGEALRAWLEEARKLAADAGRAEVADSYIGRVLAHCPMDADGTWPCLPVRKILEARGSEKIAGGLYSGLLGRQGTYIADGGKREEKLANTFSEMAKRIGELGPFPKTVAVLNDIAKCYSCESKREKDRSAYEEFEGNA